MVKPVEILIKAKDEATGVFSTVAGKLSAIAATIAGYFGFRAFLGIISDSADLEAAMSRVKAATGATAAEMAQLRKAADDAGAATKYTSVEAANALENLAKAGLSAKDSIAALPAVLVLAQAGDIELAQSSEFLTKAVMGMGLAFDQAGRVADVLALGANASNTSVVGLAQALSYAAPVAHSLGLSLEATVAIIGKFADAGIDASRAGTALNSILSQFSDPASKFREELRAAGIITNDFEQALKQLTEAGPRGQKALLAVGQEAGPALRALVGQGTASLADLKSKLDEAAGSAAATAAIMEDNLKGAFNGLGSAWDTVKTALGTPVLPVLRAGVEQLTEALRVAVSDGTAGKFGDSIAAGFQTAIKWGRDFISTIDVTKVAADLRVFADRAGEVFKEIGQHAATAGAAAQTAYGVMSAGSNAVLAVIYTLGQGFATVASGIQNGLAALYEASAKVTFGALSKQYADMAAEIRLSAGATAAAADELGAKARDAFNAMAEGAQTARDGYAKLAGAATDSTPALSGAAQAVEDLGAQLEATRQKSADAAKTIADGRKAVDEQRAAVALLREEYSRLVSAGSIQAAAEKLQQINAALRATPAAAKDAAKAAADAAAQLEGAFRGLGVVSQAELQRIRDGAIRDFGIIKASGTASAFDIQNAFAVMAQRTLDAAGAIGSAARASAQASLEAKAGAQGLSLEFDATGKVIVRAMRESTAAVQQVTHSVAATTEALKRQEEAQDRLAMKYMLSTSYTERQISLLEKENALVERRNALERERLNIDKDGFSLNAAGQRVSSDVPTQRSVFDSAKNQGLTEAQALQISRQFIQNGQRVGFGGANANAGENWGTELQKAIDKLVLANAQTSAEGEPGGGAGSTTHVIRYQDERGQTVTFNAATASDANTAAGLIKQLAQSKAAAGF